MQFDTIKHTVGEWALPAIINEDYTGLDDGDECLLVDWMEWAQDDYTDSDGNTWVFSHWGSVSNQNEFTCDEITSNYGQCYDIDAVFVLKPRS